MSSNFKSAVYIRNGAELCQVFGHELCQVFGHELCQVFDKDRDWETKYLT